MVYYILGYTEVRRDATDKQCIPFIHSCARVSCIFEMVSFVYLYCNNIDQTTVFGLKFQVCLCCLTTPYTEQSCEVWLNQDFTRINGAKFVPGI